MPVDRETFAEIMASFPSGVAIVTTLDEAGEPKGLTTSAVASVSAEPPLLLVCVDFTSRTLPALRRGLEMGAPGAREQLLVLDRLPVVGAAGVDRDRDLRKPLADVANRLDPLDHILRRPDPDDVAGDHLFVGRLREALENPGGIE